MWVCRISAFRSLRIFANERASARYRRRPITIDETGTPSVSNRSIVGTVVPAGADTLKVRLEWDPVQARDDYRATWTSSGSQSLLMAIPLASVTRLDVSSGWKRNGVNGAIIGFLAGAFFGAVSGYEHDPAYCCAPEIVLGGFGLVVGTVLGAITKTEIWKPVSLDRMAHIGITPQRHGGLALAASLRF